MKTNHRYLMCGLMVTLAFVVLLAGTSCDVTSKEDLVEVSLHRMDSRSLNAKANDTTTTYEYKATPAMANGATGATDWKSIEMVEDEATLGLFSQGVWTFELRGLNSEGTVLSYGITVTKLSAQEENKVNIVLGYLKGEGSLAISVSLEVEAYEGGTVELWYKSYENGSFGSKVSIPLVYDEETKTFGATVDKIPSGSYLMGVVYTSGEDDNSGQVLGIRILDGLKTTIQGTIENGIFYGEDMTITSLRTLKGTLGEKNLELKKDASTVLTWMDKGTIKATSFTWYIGDEMQEEEELPSFTFLQKDIQSHVVTCVAFGPNGEISSASIKISHAKTWFYQETEEAIEGISYRFDGEKLSIYRNDRFLSSLSEGDTQSLTDLRLWLSFTKEGDKVTIYRDETTPIGYFNYK